MYSREEKVKEEGKKEYKWHKWQLKTEKENDSEKTTVNQMNNETKRNERN